MGEYLKHLLRRYEGEVALAWGEWDWVAALPPRDKRLWHPQYAKNASQRKVLSAAFGASQGHGLAADNIDLRAIGGTEILEAEPQGLGHWRRRGAAITLGELFYTFGKSFSAQELLFWYHHAEKLVKKRDHPHGSQDVRDAAQLRMKTYGHYGHWGT